MIKKLGDGIFVDTTKFDIIRKLDAMIFDCDGVLIDVTNSYDLAIKKTVSFMIKKLVQIEKSDLVTTKIIDGFKATGGFNDEVDVTYALILSIIAATKMQKPITKFIFYVIKNSDQTGIKSVEKYLDSLKIKLTEIRKKMCYPSQKLNILSLTFDEIFYGAKLFYQLYKKKPQFFDGKGLIENDVVLVKKELIDKLKKQFGKKLAIVTGRGILSARHSLKKLLEEFDLKNSMFLEDKPRNLSKPNPQSLVMAIKGLNSSCTAFVGDSVEDFLMARKSDKLGNKTLFCGIYGTSKDPKTKRALFEKKGADMILETIDLIPKALNLVGA